MYYNLLIIFIHEIQIIIKTWGILNLNGNTFNSVKNKHTYTIVPIITVYNKLIDYIFEIVSML